MPAAVRRRPLAGRARDVRGPRRRHHHLYFRHLPRARRRRNGSARVSRRLRAIERAGARDPDPRRTRRRPARSSQPIRRALGHSVGLVPRHHADGDQRRPRRRACRSTMAPTWSCATSPKPKASRSRASKRSQFQLNMFNQHAARRRPRSSHAPAGQPVDDAADAEPVAGDGRDAVGVEARRPERLRAACSTSSKPARPTPTG